MKLTLFAIVALIACRSVFAQTPPRVPSKTPGKLGSNTFTNEVSVESYASFAAAIMALGRGTKTLVIPSSQTVATNVTVPANIALRFTGAGVLNISPSYSVTINGNLSAPAKQIFSGSGTVAFAANTPITVFYPQWWGVIGNGSTDDTRAMQAALNAMQSDFHMVLTPGLKVKNTSLSIAGLSNFCIEGLGGAGEAVMNMPQFIYAGRDDGVHLTIAHCRGCKFKAFQMKDWSRSVGHGAGVSIWLTQDVLPRARGGLSSDDSFEDMVIYATAASGWKGFRIYTASDNNNEWHRFKHAFIMGPGSFGSYAGTGISIEGAQPKQIKIDECVFTGMAVAISGGGSIRATKNAFFRCGICYQGQFGDTNYAIGDDSESCEQILVNPSYPFTLSGGRYEDIRGGQTGTANTSTKSVISCRAGGGQGVTITNNLFASNYGPFARGWISSNGAGPVTWRQNYVTASSDMTGLDTFQRKFSDIDQNGYPSFAIHNTFNLSPAGLIQPGGSPVVGLTDGAGPVYRCLNGSPVTFTDFTPGIGSSYASGTILYIIGNTTCSIANNSNIVTTSGTTIPPFNGKMIAFYRDRTVWRQLSGGAAAPVAITAGSNPGASGLGGWVQGQGQSQVSTQFNKTDATLANVTGLSATLQGGHTYKFLAVLDATLDPAGGAKYAIGGSCTASSISYRVRHLGASSTVTSSPRQTALGSAVNSNPGVTDDDVAIEGLITVKAKGTLTVQFAQQSANGTSSVLVGSNMLVCDVQ